MGGRVGKVLVATLPVGGTPVGLTCLLLGRTSGSAALGRRIRMGGAPFDAPFDAVGVPFRGLVGVDMTQKEHCVAFK